MRGLQGTFPRCKKCLPGDDKMQRLVLDAIVLVHNFQTEYVGRARLKLHSTQNMCVSKTWKATTELHSTTPIQESTIVKLTGAEVIVTTTLTVT